MKRNFRANIAVFWILNLPWAVHADQHYLWPQAAQERQALALRFAPPEGFERAPVEVDSFGEWLRFLPLLPGRPSVLLFDGSLKGNQAAHAAVVNMDVGSRDLQQCADAVMRLRAEYLYSVNRKDQIAFNWTNGERVAFSRWAEGYRPQVQGNKVLWSKNKKADASHTSLRAYMDQIFMYAGSYSLSKELKPVADVRQMQIGDVFIHGGFPGHAVLVVDMAEKGESKRFMLAQSYMPAQQIHILRNPANAENDPWYDLEFGETLYTPEWTFKAKDLMRFPPDL